MRTITRHYETIPGTEVEVELPIGPTYGEPIDLFASPREGGGYHVAYAVTDEVGWDFWEWDGGDENPENWPNGRFRDFRNSHDGGGQEARDEFYREMVELVGEDHVFLVEVYSHGLESFSRVDAGRFYPDRQWDVCASCVLAVPPDVTDPAGWADGVLTQWTAYVNGDVWDLIYFDVDAEGKMVGDYECLGGFFGYEEAKQGIYDNTSVKR